MENFTHNESKFEEALSITLKRKHDNKKKVKYIMRRKYRSIRTDLQDLNKRKRQKSKREKRLSNGKKVKDIIHKGHKQFALTWGMMIGVKMSIDSQNNLRKKSLKVTDFMEVSKYTIPLEIKSLSHHFKFKDYAPLAFHNLRNCWSVDKDEYINSICNPNSNFLEFMSNSKSGMYFFLSHDKKYMIKTLKRYECKFLRRILPHYVRHMIKNPNSLINQYYGLHRVKMPHLNRKIHFVVMNNIFHTPKPIHKLYDLKGSTYKGRYVSKFETKSNGSKVCGKDLNFIGFTNDNNPGKVEEGQPVPEYRQCFKIGTSERKLAFSNQIASDSVFLAKMKIMDYSLLVGVHYRDRLQDYIPNYTSDNYEKDKTMPPLFKRDDGGFYGMDYNGTLNNEIYYIGIIDILQQYNFMKFAENKYKSYVGKDCSTKISALPPKKYAKRFIEFIIDSIR